MAYALVREAPENGVSVIDYLITDTGREQIYADWITASGIEIIYA